MSNNKLKEVVSKSDKRKLMIYFILRILVVMCLIRQSLLGEWMNVALCILTLILFCLPAFISKKLKIELPNTLEVIVVLFIFSAEILGEIRNFYGTFHMWDTILHTMNGFLCAAIGFSLVDILNRSKQTSLHLTAKYLALVAFCFSMTVGVVWEFFEYSCDKIFYQDMQKDFIIKDVSSIKLNKEKENEPIVLKDIQSMTIYYKANGELKEYQVKGGYLDIGINDTMKDLMVNFLGAATFSIIGYFFVQHRDKDNFAAKFIPKVKVK